MISYDDLMPVLTVTVVMLVLLVYIRSNRRNTEQFALAELLEPDDDLENRMNYKNPRDMNREELDLFKAKYRSDFTVQDYRNWLLLYKNDPRNLRDHHRDNLRKLLRGGTITFDDLPRVLHVPPRDAASYFADMYPGQDIGVQFRNGLPKSEEQQVTVGGSPRLPQQPPRDAPGATNYLEVGATGSLLEYNFANYSNFIPPQDLEKTWITGTVDLFREKVDPHELNYYVRPDATSGDERSAIGNKYLQERLSRMLPPSPSAPIDKMAQQHRKTEQLQKIDRKRTDNTAYNFPIAN
jgi:hypothetical protein